MQQQLCFWFLVYPDLNKAVGGIKQIHRVSEIIEGLGYFHVSFRNNQGFVLIGSKVM